MADLYLDHNVPRTITDPLQRAGHTVRTAAQIGLARGADERQLLTAAQQNWVFVTHNAGHFRLLHDAWRLWSQAWNVTPEHAGILIIRPMLELDLAREVGAQLATGYPLVNELYEWQPHGGWVRRP